MVKSLHRSDQNQFHFYYHFDNSSKFFFDNLIFSQPKKSIEAISDFFKMSKKVLSHGISKPCYSDYKRHSSCSTYTSSVYQVEQRLQDLFHHWVVVFQIHILLSLKKIKIFKLQSKLFQETVFFQFEKLLLHGLLNNAFIFQASLFCVHW